MSALDWTKPGPGGWALDRAHTTGPVTPIMQDLFPGAMAAGFQSFTGRYGLALSHIDIRYVNGLPYGSVQIAGVPASDRPPPPPAVLRVLTRLHPVFRRRNKTALRALEERPWHDDLRLWFDELRPARIASLRALQAVRPEDLDDADLADHVDACIAELAAGLQEHHSLVGAAGLPVGLHLIKQEERGRSHADAITDLAGAAAASTGATIPALVAIAEALVAAGVDPSSLTDLDQVAAASPEAATALDAYLEDHGQRIVGAYDVTGRRLVELPDVVLRSIASAPAAAATLAGDGRGEEDGEVDVVLADARLAVASRDDHAGISGMWPAGLARRALLAAGARLAAAGLIAHPDHVFAARGVEIRALLTEPGAQTGAAPSAAVLAERVAVRERIDVESAPAELGEVHPPPDAAIFPTGLRRTTVAMGAFLAAMEVRSAVGVGRTTYRGRAVVAVDPEDAITRLRPGDVLVTSTTTPAFNCVLPMAGALVTAHGGLMGHAGIAARELGIPAVIGLADVVGTIADGIEVEVDPVAVTVRPAPAHIAFGTDVATPRVATDEVGGKAAGLIAMSALGLPVPPGVVLPVSRVGEDEVRAAVAHLEELTGRRLGDPDRPLIVSVRSGAAVSMPGMLDTILDVGTTPTVARALAASSGDPGFADDTRRRLVEGWAAVVGGDLPDDPVEQVVSAALAVRRSWDGERARAFRQREGIADDLGTSVTIQQMVFGNLGPDSGTAVVFSRDPSTGEPGIVGDLLVGAQGDDVVGGTHATSPIAAMATMPTPWPTVHDEVVAVVETLERHHGDLVDVELTVEQGRLHLLQVRPGRRSPAAAVRIAVALAEDPTYVVTRSDAVTRCRDVLTSGPVAVAPLADDVVAAHLVARGTPASPGRGTGVLVTSVDDALRRHDAGEAVVLVRPHTSPSDVAAMAVAAGIVTTTGGLVSHAALVARSWGLPAVVGAADLAVTDDGVTVDGRTITVGTEVTVDGGAGVLLTGAHHGSPEADGDEPAELATLRRWADEIEAEAPELHTDLPDLEVLRGIVLRGRVDVTGITAPVDRLAAEGLVVARDGSATATAEGRARIAADVIAVVAEHGPSFAALLDLFEEPDRALKQLIGEQQTTDAPAEPGLRRDVHPAAMLVIAEAADMVPRLARYADRLETALDRLAAGDGRYLAHPAVDSYHTVWFELHEELMGLAGTDRATEVAAGRA